MTANQSDTTNDVDCKTLDKKLMMGYQGWFVCPNDGSPPNRWWHWFGDPPNQSNLTVDMWPDRTELGDGEAFPTGMTCPNGTQATLYSAYNVATINRHFAWMQEYGLDGVMLQRFVCDVGSSSDTAFRDFRNRVATNVKTSAETHHRAFCIMYDITGSNEDTLVQDLKDDWAYLVNTLEITTSAYYLNHNGKPLLAIWGLGFNGSPGTPTQADEIIAHFKDNKLTILGGVPTHWRSPSDTDSDAKTDPDWAHVYTSFNVVSPWSVGRYTNEAEADKFMKKQIKPDLELLSSRSIDYMPVVFPGFSFRNAATLRSQSIQHPLNEIPRKGGRFWWRQVYNAIKAFNDNDAGYAMIYAAMFDEVDEGTAMFKLVADKQDLPNEAQEDLVYLNIDGENLRSDHYLWLANQGRQMLRGETALTPNMPKRDQTTPLRGLSRARSLSNRRS